MDQTSNPSQPTGSSAIDERGLLAGLDSARLSAFHIKMILAAGTTWIWAAYGVTAVGFILPSLRAAWQISFAQQGLLAGVGLGGMLIGAIAAGTLADKTGRLRTLYLALLWSASFSLISALAASYPVLLVLRFLTGAGLGAILPGTSALVSEYSPVRNRGAILVLLNGFWGLGVALAAGVSWLLVPRLGWQAVFLFGGLTLLSIPLAYMALPESLRFLFENGRTAEAVQTTRRFHFKPAPVIASVNNLEPVPASGGNSQPRQSVWSGLYRGRTIRLWILWFSLNFLFQGVFIWLPTLLQAAGHSPQRASLYTLTISLGQIPGAFAAAALVDRAGRRVSLAGFLLLYAAAAFLFGISASPAGVLLWGFLISFCNGATWGMAYPYTTELYPTRIRGAAVGWATGIGRSGGIVAPILIGALIQAGAGSGVVYTILAAEAALTTLVLIGLRQETAGKALEEISG